MTGHDDRAMTEDHVELCGTPIFDSLVDEIRGTTSGNGVPHPGTAEDDAEVSEPPAERKNE